MEPLSINSFPMGVGCCGEALGFPGLLLLVSQRFIPSPGAG